MKYKRIFILGLLLMSAGAQAQAINPGLTDTWVFRLGVFNQHNSADISLTAPNNPITEIDLDDLGLKSSKNVPQFGVRRRFGDKWSVGVYYSDFGISSSKTVETEFNYDGVTYPVNASLETSIGLDLFVASVDYAFHKSDTTEWGVGFGLHALDFGLDINATLNDVDLAAGSGSVLAPLPNIRFYTHHAFSPKLMGSFNVGWLSANVDEYDGEILVGAVGLDYRFAERWSIGANYQITNIDLKIDKGSNRPNSRYDLELSGFSILINYSIP